MDEIEKIQRMVLEIVNKNNNLRVCHVCGGTTFTPIFLGVTFCAYCGGKGYIKNE